MIIKNNNFSINVDVENTKEYSRTHSLCTCNEDQNFYIQVEKKLPNLSKFLMAFGLYINRPDEIASHQENNDIHYDFVSYTIIGEILNAEKYELTFNDDNYNLEIIMDKRYIPNEQKTKNYFTITIYNIIFPYILKEKPFS